jgi:hypothetical protein
VRCLASWRRQGCCEGTGRSAAVRGRGGVGGGSVMSGITCCKTADARGIAIVPFAVVAGVIRI